MTAKATLTSKQVAQLRAAKARDGANFSPSQWAKKFKVHKSTVSRAARGKAFAEVGDGAESANAVRMIPWRKIYPHIRNPRRIADMLTLGELAQSIAELGVVVPLRVATADANGKHAIVYGERRWRAVELLVKSGAKNHDFPMPCVVASHSEREALLIALAENLARADMHPLDEAAAYKRLIDTRMMRSPAKIGAHIGRSARHVQSRLRLLQKLTPGAQAALRDGRITLAQAEALADGDHEQQVHVLEKLADFATEAAIRDYLRPAPTERAAPAGDPPGRQPSARLSAPANKKTMASADPDDPGVPKALQRGVDNVPNGLKSSAPARGLKPADPETARILVPLNSDNPEILEVVRDGDDADDARRRVSDKPILAVYVHDPVRKETWWFNRGHKSPRVYGAAAGS
ncbi:MAG: ParB/RepB/Spo0J family partition protein [Sulfuritalea sp.]|nr:ParB/RepB/Spo0J family partition protein [Sulfuritalea sp.]